MRGLPLSPRHFRAIAGGYGALVVALTVLLFVLDARVSERIGLQREVYPDVGFSGIPRVDVSRGISLDFLREDPPLPRRFFSVRWNGFWYLPEAGEFELRGAGNDRLDVWVDGERVIRRGAPAGMYTQSRTLWLEAGVHRLRVDYEQHGEARALSLLWAPRGERPRPLPSHHMFQAWPDRDAIRLANRATWLKRIVPIGWGVPVALGVAFLSRHARFRTLVRKLTRATGRQPHGHRADEIAAAPPEPLVGSGLLAVHAVFLGLSALFCSRAFLLTDLDSHAILGGDPALMNWQLQWVSRALYTDPLNLFNGNTFHPHPNVVALTDHMLSLAVINAPLSILSDSPWFGYNLLIFFAYYLSCVGGYWFMREVTGSHQAGFWAGIFWAFLFFRIHHIGHLQVLSFQWMPFVAATLIRFLRSPTGARTLALSACFVAQALVSWYHAVITTILVLVLSVLQIGRQRLTLRHAASAAAAAALCAAVILPTAIPYRRSLEETQLGNRYAEALVPRDRVSVSRFAAYEALVKHPLGHRAVYRLGWVGRAWFGPLPPAGAGALAGSFGRSPIRTRVVSCAESWPAHLGTRDDRPISWPSLILTALHVPFPLLSISSTLSSAPAVRARFSCAAVHRRRISFTGTSCPVFVRTRPATRSTLISGLTVPRKMASVSKSSVFARRTMSGREFPEYVLSKPKSVFVLRCSSMVWSTSSRAACCFLGLFQSPRPLAMLSAL